MKRLVPIVVGASLASCGQGGGATGPSGSAGSAGATTPVVQDGVVVTGHVPTCKIVNLPQRIDGALAVDPTNDDVVYVGIEGKGVYATRDGGLTWARSIRGMKAYVADDTQDFCFEEFYDAAIDPSDPRRVCVARKGSPGTLTDFHGMNEGVNCSDDGGATWTQLASDGMNTCTTAVALDPRDPLVIYAGVAGQPDMDGRYLQTVSSLYRSSDRGAHWAEVDLGNGFVKGTGIGQIAVGVDGAVFVGAPVVDKSAPSPEHAFDGTQFGLFRSPDDAAGWSASTQGMNGENAGHAVMRVGISPHDPARLFVVSAAYPPTPGPYFYVSTDGGATFAPGQRSGNLPIDVFAFDPTDAAGTHLLGLYTFDPDLHESHDGGATWSTLGPLPPDAYDHPVRLTRMAWSHQRAEVIYLAGSHASVYRSADAGHGWTKVLSLETLP